MEQVWMSVVTIVLGTVVGWVLNAFKNKAAALRQANQHEEEERDKNRKILGELLFFILEDYYERYVVKGVYCSAADMRHIEKIYKYYSEDLGLNGPGRVIYNEIMSTGTRKGDQEQ